jgi:hypothetical protein
MNDAPIYPIFIPTKGRHKTPFTISEFERLKVPYTAVIEKQEYESYLPIVKTGKILILPHQNKGLTKTRNWIWDYAQHELNAPFFWTFDDNIKTFYRFNNGMRIRLSSRIFLKIIEDFVGRYENVAIAGMHYKMFAITSLTSCIKKPFLLNTRVYSNMLIRTDIPFRNELFYNDDTDLCLRALKSGFCTMLFYAFLADKITTMTISGGMTDYYKDTDNRLEFARELQAAHPDVVKITRKYGRWHHHVDYRPFRGNKLIKKEGVGIPDGPNEYGMKLVHKDEDPALIGGN